MASIETPTESARQFCRSSIHSCVPAITLTFDNGARRLHWCADHADDAERYRASSDQATTYRIECLYGVALWEGTDKAVAHLKLAYAQGRNPHAHYRIVTVKG